MIRRRAYLTVVASGVAGTLPGEGRGSGRAAGSSTAARSEPPGFVLRQTKLTADDGEENDVFGKALAADDTTALVGAPGATNPDGVVTGGAYVFERTADGWIQQATVTDPDGNRDEAFGRAVALDGDTALVGSRDKNTRHGTDAGAVFVLARERDTDEWERQTTLLPPDGEPFDEFGNAVALDGDTALVGAWARATIPESGVTPEPGAAYVFERSEGAWRHRATLTADDTDPGAQFGNAVALDGDTALVGAWRAVDPDEEASGAAYVFERAGGTWRQRGKLTTADGSADDSAGAAVALQEETALVAAPGEATPNGDFGGAVYVFERTADGWHQRAKLAAHDGDSFDFFGSAVALDGDTAIIGARGEEDVAEGSEEVASAGAAYVFGRTGRTDGGWLPQAKLIAADAAHRNHFGDAVALAGGTVLGGAPRVTRPNDPEDGSPDTTAFAVGAAYAFRLAPAVGDDGIRAADLDGDGRYEDVNGDGEATPGDATTLFDAVFDRDADVAENVSLFDFNGDGGVTPGDASVLFDELR